MRDQARRTQARIINVLRGRGSTVDELAAALGLTRGAVRLHLANLGRDALVHVVGTRLDEAVPALCRYTRSGSNSRALLSAELHVLYERMAARKFDEFMRTVGPPSVAKLLAGRARPHGRVLARAEAASGLSAVLLVSRSS